MTGQRNDQGEVQPTIEGLKMLLPGWISRNAQHIQDSERWVGRMEDAGLKEVARELKAASDLLKEANRHIGAANASIEGIGASGPKEIPEGRDVRGTKDGTEQKERVTSFELRQIGVVRTPYTDDAPYQPVEEDEGDFRIVVEPRYTEGLHRLAGFRYIYVIYYLHHIERELSMMVCPPWAGGEKVGVFASRSPVRPNRIGLSIVRIKHITKNEIMTSGLDVFDGTPVLDIKPYIEDLDAKSDANYGWIKEMEDNEHLLLHIKGIPHDY